MGSQTKERHCSEAATTASISLKAEWKDRSTHTIALVYPVLKSLTKRLSQNQNPNFYQSHTDYPCVPEIQDTVLHRMKKHLMDRWRLWIWSYLNRAPVFLCPWLLAGDLCHTWEEWLCIAGTGHLRCRADAGHAMRSNPPVMWFWMGASYYLALIDLEAEVMWAIN